MSNIEQTKVFIDPGHGLPDPGAVSASGLREMDVVLKIAEYTKSRLDAYGATSQMSRTGDNALSSDKNTDLNLRVERSNDFGANVFVSIHNNSHDTTSPNGVETLVGPDASLTRRLASEVNALVVSSTGFNARSVVERDIRVIRSDNNAWAILVEVGFLSNVSDAQKLATTTTQRADWLRHCRCH